MTLGSVDLTLCGYGGVGGGNRELGGVPSSEVQDGLNGPLTEVDQGAGQFGEALTQAQPWKQKLSCVDLNNDAYSPLRPLIITSEKTWAELISDWVLLLPTSRIHFACASSDPT